MYIVRFIRRDKQPAELYYYPRKEDALYHLNMFQDDDSELYTRIDVVEDNEKETMIASIIF